MNSTRALFRRFDTLKTVIEVMEKQLRSQNSSFYDSPECKEIKMKLVEITSQILDLDEYIPEEK